MFRLQMDGTTRAAKHSYIVSPQEYTNFVLPYENNMQLFECYRKLAKKLHCRGLLYKHWLVIPMFVRMSHLVFYAFLNLTSLCEEQSKTFTAYFMYDSSTKRTTRKEDLAYLDRYGVTSFLVYVVHHYGTPKPGGTDVRTCLFDPTYLPKIHLHPEDNHQQDDNNDCGIFCIMSMVHFCCSTSHLISQPTDLEKKEGHQLLFPKTSLVKLVHCGRKGEIYY
jgi:hypothetical protein